MEEPIPRAEKVAPLLKERGETIAIAESSTGGVGSAALLDIADAALTGMRASTEADALLLARTAQQRVSAT